MPPSFVPVPSVRLATKPKTRSFALPQPYNVRREDTSRRTFSEPSWRFSGPPGRGIGASRSKV
jgi:hypothetical protein